MSRSPKSTPSKKNVRPVKDRGVLVKTGSLKGKRIALALCGGIGATEVVKIAREIRRHGAVVEAFLTPDALRFVTALSVEWATLSSPIIEPSAKVEYLEEFDAVLVAPLTLNTLSKLAVGISDNAVCLLVASQLGAKRPVFVVPAMNAQLWEHPVYQTHEQVLKNWGVRFWNVGLEEDRLKMPAAEKIVDWLIKEL